MSIQAKSIVELKDDGIMGLTEGTFIKIDRVDVDGIDPESCTIEDLEQIYPGLKVLFLDNEKLDYVFIDPELGMNENNLCMAIPVGEGSNFSSTSFTKYPMFQECTMVNINDQINNYLRIVKDAEVIVEGYDDPNNSNPDEGQLIFIFDNR